jgi:hypothetical protein
MGIFNSVELDQIRDGVAEILRVLTALDQKITIYQIKGEKFMASASQALIDLQTAVNTLVTGMTNLQAADAAIDAALATLESQVSGQNGVSAADVEAVVAQLKTASGSLGTVITDLNTQVSKAQTNATAVTVSPTSATVAQGSTQQFTAVVTGDSSNAVVWTLTPATGAGSIDQTGLYTPPTTPGGSAQVTATSKANPAIFANASVTY